MRVDPCGPTRERRASVVDDDAPRRFADRDVGRDAVVLGVDHRDLVVGAVGGVEVSTVARLREHRRALPTGTLVMTSRELGVADEYTVGASAGHVGARACRLRLTRMSLGLALSERAILPRMVPLATSTFFTSPPISEVA